MAKEKTPSPGADSSAGQDIPGTASTPTAKAETAAKPVPKEKPPAPEDKPFAEFIQQDLLPSLTTALREKGLEDIRFSFDQRPLPVFGIADTDPYWQIQGVCKQGSREFAIVFTKDTINGPKLFYHCDHGSQPSTIEQFMGDERKATLDLMVLFLSKRLNGQKWLARN